jgi:anaerobic selenocysteine-containing dehydrogenase
MKIRTVCNRDCPDVCSIVATVDDGRVTRLDGDPDHPVTRGFLCPRTRRFLGLQYGPDRVKTPLYRESLDQDFRPVAWDDALDVAARRLLAIRAESGPSSIFHYRSGGSLGLLVEATDRFFAAFGPVTTKGGDICNGAAEWAQEQDFGTSDSSDLFDLLNARHIVLWGKNPHTSSPHVFALLKDAVSRGAGLVLVDPVHHRTAGIVERHIQPRPGGDASLAMAVARIVLDMGWADPDAGNYCENLDSFRALVESRSVSEWCFDADVLPADAMDLARRLGPGRPASLLIGWGLGRRLNGASTVRALDALALLSGNIGIPGACPSFYFRRKGAFDRSILGGNPVPPRHVREALFGLEIETLADPPIRAVWITAANPVVMLPDSARTALALESRDFVVVADPFLTDTARCAHLVLPVPTLLESDDIMGSYGNHWIGVSRPVVPSHCDVRSDLEIMQGLSERTGLGDLLTGTARDFKRRLIRTTLGPRGITLEDLEDGPIRNPLAPRILFEGRRFPTPSGRARLMDVAPPPPEPRTVDFPLVLMALSTPESQCSQWSAPRQVPPQVTVHPDAAAGVPDGGLAFLESALGRMEVQVRHDPMQRLDLVVAPKGGWFQDGACANAIVSGRLTDAGEGVALYDEPVRLSASFPHVPG